MSNQLYIGKFVTLSVKYRGKLRSITYVVEKEFNIKPNKTDFVLKSIKYPCEIKHLQTIEIEL